MNFNDLLRRDNIDPDKVIVARHAELTKVLSWFAEDMPEIFNGYQQSQSSQLEAALMRLRNAGYLASFLAYGPAKAIFVGIFKIGNSRSLNEKQFWAIPANNQLKKHGYLGFIPTLARPTIEQFELTLTPFRENWKGRLIVDWPGGERSWWRRAENNDFSVHAVLEESALAKSMPDWDQLYLTWNELQAIPKSWRAAMRQWAGIYCIRDVSDGKFYVGSASGSENLLGRWENYALTGHGSNKLLKTRNPNNFCFSILERVSPDMEQQKIIAKENSWKLRLATRQPSGLNDN